MDINVPELPADLSTWDAPYSDYMNMPMDTFEQEKLDSSSSHVIEMNLTALDGIDNFDSLNFRKKRIKSILGELSVTKQKSESKRVQESEIDFQESLLECMY